jgi:hypothetical protein
MGAIVTVGPEEITIRLSGLNVLPTFRRSVHIPLAAVRTIRSEGAADANPGKFGALTGVHSGIVRRNGRKVLVACRPDRPTVTLELDRDTYPDVGFDTVVLTAGATAISLPG